MLRRGRAIKYVATKAAKAGQVYEMGNRSKVQSRVTDYSGSSRNKQGKGVWRRNEMARGSFALERAESKPTEESVAAT